jgi:RNA polymerase sigma factor (sigma-70 family)
MGRVDPEDEEAVGAEAGYSDEPDAAVTDDLDPDAAVNDGLDGNAEAATAKSLPAQADETQLRVWIARIVERDEAALGLLYDSLVGRVFGLALRITRQPATAEEVTEDTFWQIWRQAPRYDTQRGAAAAWVMTIARSRALDAVRRALPESHNEDFDAAAHWMSGATGDPQDLLSAVQEGHSVQHALTSLDPLPRQLVALAFFRGLTHEEIAGHTGLPLGTVKSHIRRALVSMRATLATA